MPRSINSYKSERCRASQRYYSRPQYPNPGHGECCRYEPAQMVHEYRWSAVKEVEQRQTEPERCRKPTTLSRRAKFDSMQDSGYDDSTSQSSYLEEADLSMSAISTASTVSTTSTSSSESSAAIQSQTVPSRSSNDIAQLVQIRRELEQCRGGLQRLFQSCNRPEFEGVCCAISCVYNSARPLSRNELAAATNLSSLGRNWQRSMQDEQWTQLDQWIQRCSEIFIETLDGKFDFIYPTTMRIFLRSLRIPGLDISHRAFAIVCRNQRELQKLLARNESARPDLVQAVQVMSPYVVEFGDRHLRLASLTSMIGIAEGDSCTKTNDDFEVISRGTKQLSIGEEKGDWVVVKET